MPNVNGSESTSPPHGGNVEEPRKTTPQSFSETKSSNNRTIFDTYQTQQDVDPKARQPCSSTQIQRESNVTDVSDACPIEGTSQVDRERVIRELGVTSTSFIGPVRRPEPSIEQELSEFYKELEEVDNVDRDAYTESVEQQILHSSHKPESDLPNQENIPAVVTDHSRAYRPYTDPREHNQKDQKRWRPRLQGNRGDFGRGRFPELWYPPPTSWVSPDPRIQFFPPPTCANLYPPDMRPQENIYSLHTNNNNSWGPWEGPALPLNRWHDGSRGFHPHEYPRCSEEYEAPLSHWQRCDYEEDRYQPYNNTASVLILLRGVPGSGKSTLARELLSAGPSGVILSTDDYFFQDNRYVFDSALLGDAHEWNQQRAERAMLEGRSPVIIDNTNVKAWEMKPYVIMALENGYRVDFLEPDTRWKFDPVQLEKRNKHGVPRETIAKMLDGFERPVNVDIVMNSMLPPRKRKGR